MESRHHIEFIKINLLISGASISALQFDYNPDLFLLVTGFCFLTISILHSFTVIAVEMLSELESDGPLYLEVHTIWTNIAGILAFGLAFSLVNVKFYSGEFSWVSTSYYSAPYLIGPGFAFGISKLFPEGELITKRAHSLIRGTIIISVATLFPALFISIFMT